jgi:hypothetical protein
MRRVAYLIKKIFVGYSFLAELIYLQNALGEGRGCSGREMKGLAHAFPTTSIKSFAGDERRV